MCERDGGGGEEEREREVGAARRRESNSEKHGLGGLLEGKVTGQGSDA